jgi:hypothetical protein
MSCERSWTALAFVGSYHPPAAARSTLDTSARGSEWPVDPFYLTFFLSGCRFPNHLAFAALLAIPFLLLERQFIVTRLAAFPP